VKAALSLACILAIQAVPAFAGQEPETTSAAAPGLTSLAYAGSPLALAAPIKKCFPDCPGH